MSKKSILLLTQWFDPEPTFKGLLFAKALKKKGFDVEVVTGFPNYPGGTLYEGYKIRLRDLQFIDGVKVTRLALYPSHDSSALKRILNYLSFAFTSLIYMLFFAKRADVIYAYHPPLTIGVVAVVTRFFRRTPVVYDIQDMWPDTLQATGMLNNKKLLSFIGKVAQWVYARIDQMVVLSPGFKRLLIQRGVEDEKITVIPNWCDENALTSAEVKKQDVFPEQDQSIKIMFAGNMGKAQALEVVIEAAQQLQEKKANIAFIMIGGGLESKALKAKSEALGLKNITFLAQMPMTEIGAYLEQADVLLVHLKKDPLFEITIPGKTQAYLSIGKPILMGVQGDAADIVTQAKSGFVFEPENPDSLLAQIDKISQLQKQELVQMGQNSKAYYDSHLSLKIGVDSFTRVFDSAIRE